MVMFEPNGLIYFFSYALESPTFTAVKLIKQDFLLYYHCKLVCRWKFNFNNEFLRRRNKKGCLDRCIFKFVSKGEKKNK